MTRRNAAQIVAFTFALAIAASWLVNRHVAADDWLPVPPADLALKDNPAEPGTDAMILYRSSHVDARRSGVDGEFDLEYVRIKVFTARGAELHANVRLPYLRNDEDIKDVAARTVQPDGSVVNFDGKVFDKTTEATGDFQRAEKSFSLQQVQPGSVIEYRYRLVYKSNYLWGQNWLVSSHLFMRDAYFTIEPYVPRGNMAPALYFRSINLAPGLLPQHQGDGSYKMEVHNLPGLVAEPLSPPARMLEARVEFFYRAAGTPATQTTEQFWNDTGRTWSEHVDKFTDKKNALAQVVSQTVAESDTPEQKLRKLYERAQKIPNLNYQRAKSAAERKAEDIKPNENVEDVLKHDYAYGRQINWLFVGLARAAGFEASEVYIADRNWDTFSPSGQNAAQLNDNLVWVKAGDKEYWLNPSAPYYPFGLLPWPETESKGVRVSKNGGDFIQTPAAPSSDTTVSRTANLTLATDGNASGSAVFQFAGVSAASRRTALHEADETGRKKHLQHELEGALPQGSTVEITSISDWVDTSKPFTVAANLTLPNYGSTVGRRILFPASLFVSAFRASFDNEKRVNPIRFPERFEDIDDVTVHVPDGYSAEAMPPEKDVKSGTSFVYQLSGSGKGSTIEIKKRFVLGDISFPRDQYAALRALFSNFKTYDESQFVVSTSPDAKPATASTTAPAKE